MNKVFKTGIFILYCILDLCITLAIFPIVIFKQQFKLTYFDLRFNLDMYFTYGVLVYLLIISVTGMIWQRHHNKAAETNSSIKNDSAISADCVSSAPAANAISEKWIYPLYLTNVVGIFAVLFLTVFFTDTLGRLKLYDYALLDFLQIASLIVIMIGLPKWERMFIKTSSPKFIKYIFCITNPIRTAFIFLVIFGMNTPSV